MFENKEIKEDKKWYGKEIKFEPDSSPEAWNHYKKYYLAKFGEDYNFDKKVYYNHYSACNLRRGYYNKTEQWFNYVNLPLADTSRFNRLYILEKSAKIEKNDNKEYIEPAMRLSGECDFNFNDKKYKLFENIIKTDLDVCKIEYAINKLKKCKEKHHTLVNFSLMQSVGNMQGFKGSNRFDRFDTFVNELSQYYSGLNVNVLSASSDQNKFALVSYLNNSFDDVYDYCKSIYFISSKEFVDKIISQGSMPIITCDDVVRYMNLAEEYWNLKEEYFKH